MKQVTIIISNLTLSVLVLCHISFAQTTFSEQIIIGESRAKNPCSVYSADLDGDGDMDVLSASYYRLSSATKDHKIAWYENIDGQGTFGDQQVITNSAQEPMCVFSSDLDGDGDMDVLSASSSQWGNKIAWYENTDGKGTFGEQQVITDSADGARSVYAADLDNDGDMDVLSASYYDFKIAWYENTDGLGTFGDQQVITTLANGASSVTCSDLDGDGDMDVLSASAWNDRIAWYENIDGSTTFGEQQVITNLADGARSVYTGDLDGDGDIDVVSASSSDDKIAWYENIDGLGTYGDQQVIKDLANGAWCVCIGDFDSDGDMDVASASSEDDKIAWFENMDGNGTFSDQKVISRSAVGARSIHASDLDGDGDMDIVCAAYGVQNTLFGGGYWYDKITWYENTDGYGTFIEQPDIGKSVDGPSSVYASDLDGDGDLDVLSASKHDRKIALYENTDGLGSFGSQQVISDSAHEATSVTASDLDGDGDMDVLSASYYDDKIAWYENVDNNLIFGEQQIITTMARGATSVHTSDLDGDGDMDVLSASWGDWKIAWYENIDGLGTFGSQKVISKTVEGAQCVYATDLDGDGDMDVLSASRDDNTIAWWGNYDGQGSFGAKQVITTDADGAWGVYAADLDGDGDMDVLSASFFDDKITWYENMDGQGTFGGQKIISSSINGARSVYAADLDNDGDMDVVSASFYMIQWYENTDGNGHFSDPTYIGTAKFASSVYACDFDSDGDMDILYTSEQNDFIAWNKNLFVETSIKVAESDLPKNFNLNQNYPNPFNTSTIIQFTLPRSCFVSIKVYDLQGRVIETLIERWNDIGIYDVSWDAKDLPSGIYIYRLKTEDYSETKKLILQR